MAPQEVKQLESSSGKFTWKALWKTVKVTGASAIAYGIQSVIPGLHLPAEFKAFLSTAVGYAVQKWLTNEVPEAVKIVEKAGGNVTKNLSMSDN